jgi:hypothetical protein
LVVAVCRKRAAPRGELIRAKVGDRPLAQVGLCSLQLCGELREGEVVGFVRGEEAID